MPSRDGERRTDWPDVRQVRFRTRSPRACAGDTLGYDAALSPDCRATIFEAGV